MLTNENAKGKSDLVFTRNDPSKKDKSQQLIPIFLLNVLAPFRTLDSKLSINDFHLIKVLGRGAFGKVFIHSNHNHAWTPFLLICSVFLYPLTQVMLC